MFDKVNASANTILSDIQNLLENPTKPADDPPDATAYSITDGEVHDEMRDGLCEVDVSAMERDELEDVHVGAGYGAALSTEQLRQATIAGNIPSVILDSSTSSMCVKPPTEDMQTSKYGEYTWNAPLTAAGK